MSKAGKRKRQKGVLDEQALHVSRAQDGRRKERLAERELLESELLGLRTIAEEHDVAEILERNLAGKYDLHTQVSVARELLSCLSIEPAVSKRTEPQIKKFPAIEIGFKEREEFIRKRKATLLLKGRSYFYWANKKKTMAEKDKLARKCLNGNGFDPDTLSRRRNLNDAKVERAVASQCPKKLPHREKESPASIWTVSGGHPGLGKNK
ncbi:MAG: hypothetical protein WD273_02590 [Trueperaceae bacterium]